MSESLALRTDQPSIVRHWLDKARRAVGGSSHLTHTAKHVVQTGQAYGEGVATGAVLGALNAELATGLDVQGKYPIDGAVALAGAVLPLLPMFHDVAADARNIGASAATIYAFRKTDKLLRAKRAGMAGDFGAESTGDPILDAARLRNL